MLIGYDVIFIFRVRRLVLRWDIDEFVREMWRAVEFLFVKKERLSSEMGMRDCCRERYFEQVGEAGLGKVNIGVGGIFGLCRGEKG